MSGRTTRTKLKFQADKILTKITGIYRHLQYIDELAGEKSSYIDENLPTLTYLTEAYEKVIKEFREGL